jgi:hypothetical protein
MRILRGGLCAECGHLRHHGGDPVIDASDDQRDRRAETVAPQGDAAALHALRCGGVRDGVAVAPGLQPRVDLLTRFTTAGPEVAVIIGSTARPARWKTSA